MIGWLRHLIGWTVNGFRSRENLLLENLALRQPLLALHSHRPRSRLSTGHKLFWVVLRGLWSGWKAARAGHTQDGGGLAARRLSPVLEMALASQTSGREETCEPGGSGFDLTYGV